MSSCPRRRCNAKYHLRVIWKDFILSHYPQMILFTILCAIFASFIFLDNFPSFSFYPPHPFSWANSIWPSFIGHMLLGHYALGWTLSFPRYGDAGGCLQTGRTASLYHCTRGSGRLTVHVTGQYCCSQSPGSFFKATAPWETSNRSSLVSPPVDQLQMQSCRYGSSQNSTMNFSALCMWHIMPHMWI